MRESVYVVNQPTHALLSLVVIDSSLPLSSEAHEGIETLREVSDVGFVFMPKTSKKVNLDKFTSLYRGCFWLEPKDSITNGTVHALTYAKEIFECHVGFCIFVASELAISDEIPERLVKINMSSLSKPIFTAARLSSEDFGSIYMNPSKILGVSKNADDRKYTTHRSDSFMFIRPLAFGNLIASCGEKYLNTFRTWNDPRYFFASGFKYVGIDNLNISIKDLDVGEI